MVWLCPTVGYVDNVGRLRCAECAEERHRDVAVSGDMHFGADDVCETCGWKFEHLPSSKYVHCPGDWGNGVPDWKHSK